MEISLALMGVLGSRKKYGFGSKIFTGSDEAENMTEEKTLKPWGFSVGVAH
jgi:hypothetical protein